MSNLVQVTKRTGTITQVKPGERPVLELHLEDNQTLVSVELHEGWQARNRKTIDWRWVAYVATTIEPVF